MADNVPLPPEFLERMAGLLGDEFHQFAAALAAPPVSGLRINTLKISKQEFLRIVPFPIGGQVPWSVDAFVIERQELSPGNHPYHRAGLYYLQDPTAMLPAVLLDPQPDEWVLDLAAAPGGKTTHLSTLMGGRGFLLANDIKTKRVGHLAMNVARWGAGNTAITNDTPERLAGCLGAVFDRVLVDAPCSGEGMFRKDMGARRDWSLEMVRGCAVRQKQILRLAARLVRPGGCLLYSTCTFAPQENEEVVLDLIRESPEFHVVPAPQIPGSTGGRADWVGGEKPDPLESRQLAGAVRLFPHHVRGEGHFACLLQRAMDDRPNAGTERRTFLPVPMNRIQSGLWQDFAENTLAKAPPQDRLHVQGDRLFLLPEVLPVLAGLRLSSPGTWLGTFKKDRFEPAHSLALVLTSGAVRNVVNFHADDPSLATYLHGAILDLEGEPGWVLMAVDGFGLGWGKRVQGRIKNHYPRGWM